jgi:hypothetical protein
MWRRCSVAFFLLCACNENPGSLPRPGGNLNSARIPLGEPLPLARPSASAIALAPRPADAPVLRTTPYDIILERPLAKTPIFSYADYARAAFERDLAAGDAGDAGDAGVPLTIRELNVTPVAWVGPLLSLEERMTTAIFDRQRHDELAVRLVTLRIDEHAPPQARATIASLTEYADEDTLVRELLKEPRVKNALRGSGKPKGLTELIATLSKKQPELGKYCSSFPPDLMRRFAIDHVVGEHLVVHLAFETTEICGDAQTEAGLFIPAPASLATAITDAKTGRAGFFAIDKPQGLATVHLRLTSDDAKAK